MRDGSCVADDDIISPAISWLNETAARFCDKKQRFHVGNVEQRDDTEISSEEVGVAIGGACLAVLENNVPSWIGESDKALAQLNARAANDSATYAKFCLELSALVLLYFRFAIQLAGLDNELKRLRILNAFDVTTRERLNGELLELTERRLPRYAECMQQNKPLNLMICFNHFLLGGEAFGVEPMRGCGGFEAYARGMTAIAAAKAAFHTCRGIFQQSRLA